jgi:CheY-like chemotaxis protein
MTKVLLVEDEPIFRQQLEFCLVHRGHEVRSAANGRDAIEVGCHYWPDVLVTDWLLNDSIHGLHVAEALHAISPATQIILITGFPSHDLQHAARAAGIARVLDKPFAVERLDQLVRELAAAPATAASRLIVPVCEFDAHGNFVHGNELARQLFERPAATAADNAVGRQPGGTAPRGAVAPAQLDAAVGEWLPLDAESAVEPVPPWQMRARSLGSQGWLVVLRPRGLHFVENLPVVRVLLGIAGPGQADRAFRGHSLIVAREAVVRQIIGSTLAALDCVFHSTGSLADAGRLLGDDPQVGVVIFHAAGFADPAGAVDQFAAIGPQAVIVYSGPRACDAAAHSESDGLGEVVRELLNGRMGTCSHCGRPVYCVRLDPALDGRMPRCTCAETRRR